MVQQSTRPGHTNIRPRRGDGRARHQKTSGRVLALPAIVVSLALVAFPFVAAFLLSLSDTSGGQTVGSFSGADNYLRMAGDPIFWKSLAVTAEIFIVGLAVQTALGLPLGYLMSLDVPGQKIMQALLLIPTITAPVAVGLLWLLIYDPTLGLANYILSSLGGPRVAWLGNPHTVVWSVIAVDTWQWVPFMGLIISAGIRAMPSEPLEAASVDGAGWINKARHVGLPLLVPVLTVAVLIRSVDLIRFFPLVYVLTQGGPVNSSTTLNLYGYKQGFLFQDFGYASALQIVLIVCVFAVAAVTIRLRSRGIDYADAV